MSVTLKFYQDRASHARGEAEAASLDNVRDRHLRAAEAWDVLATRRARTNRLRVETDARKAAAALAVVEGEEADEEEEEAIS